MKTSINKIFLSILILIGLAACNPYSLSTKEHKQITKNISIEKLKQVDCVDDIEIYISNNNDAFIWSCDGVNGGESGLYLTERYYNGYSFFARYDRDDEELTVDVYSYIMESTFDSKSEMERVVFAEVIREMKNIQGSLNRKRKQEKKKLKLNNEFS